MKIDLTMRDKKLLLLLGIVALLLLPWFFIITPLSDKILEMENTAKERRDQYLYLVELEGNKKFYEEEVERFAQEEADIMGQFPADLPQEASILFFNNLEDFKNVKLYQTNYEAAQPGEVMRSSTTFSYEASYDSFKDFLNYIKTNGSRMVADSVTASYADGMVKGEISIFQYAYPGKEREVKETVIPNMRNGVGNIFDCTQVRGDLSAATQPEEPSNDLFVTISQPEADVEAVILGMAEDGTEESYLRSTKNALHKIRLTFTGEAGEYKVVYELGKEKKETEISHEGPIVLQILSSTRVNNKDKVSAQFTMANETDTKVILKLLAEDPENPRVRIAGKTGDIEER